MNNVTHKADTLNQYAWLVVYNLVKYQKPFLFLQSFNKKKNLPSGLKLETLLTLIIKLNWQQTSKHIFHHFIFLFINPFYNKKEISRLTPVGIFSGNLQHYTMN